MRAPAFSEPAFKAGVYDTGPCPVQKKKKIDEFGECISGDGVHNSHQTLKGMCGPLCSQLLAVLSGLAFSLQITRDLIPRASCSALRKIRNVSSASLDPKTPQLRAACLCSSRGEPHDLCPVTYDSTDVEGP